MASKWLAAALLSLGSAAQAFTVFSCEPEWAALTRVLLPSAKVHVATHAGQDPHHIEARPSLIAQLRASDLAVCTGASLESGWLPMLQQRAGRAVPVFEASDHVELIDPQPGAIGSPWAGDVHAEGNPHLHTDPRKLLEVAKALSEELQQRVPAEKLAIAQRAKAFESAWTGAIARWQQQAAPLKGKKVAGQHSSFGYLWRWLGITQIADLEPKPGMAPTPGHLQRLLDGLKAQPPLAVVVSSYQDPRSARWLTQQIGRPLLVLPATVAEDAAQDGLLRWMDAIVTRLTATASAPLP